MAEIIDVEPVVVVQDPPVVTTSKNQTVEYVIYYVLGAVEVLLCFRLILKLLGAGLRSGFVDAIYAVSGIFILPFEGIFKRGYTQGVETTSVLEPSTIVAMIVYSVLVWGIINLWHIITKEQPIKS